jgi:hypothetical protein
VFGLGLAARTRPTLCIDTAPFPLRGNTEDLRLRRVCSGILIAPTNSKYNKSKDQTINLITREIIKERQKERERELTSTVGGAPELSTKLITVTPDFWST